MEEQPVFDSSILIDIINTKMPFGKYKGYTICNLPEFYLVWFKQRGFPKGRIGILLETIYEIKLNGLEYLINNIKKYQK